MITSLLIANRGEIACRIMRTARRLSIRTVAVYSEADANALHVREADEAIAIGPAPAAQSYLDIAKLIAAARTSGAEAIHPGYGFLSENADFAQAVRDAGLIWVGPDPASIIAMGQKDEAKRRMIAAGVPVTPGYLGEDQSAARMAVEADAIGYPLLIKAVSGGGGKGIRRVDHPQSFGDALASCRREAAAAFGDDRVLLEKYIASPRHIEVQIFGDRHGHIVHLFERDCSLQRRHQKIIEEAPAPGMDESTRAALCHAAVEAARAVDYVGAGTVEFIADGSNGLHPDKIWFMEMNTRLQVEHPVTEAITGVDLVEWQLKVAGGETLPLTQSDIHVQGWAMEARVYAEDPAREFLPSIGRLDHFDLGQLCRIETGVGQGDIISSFYDPMIAKVIAHGADREAARARLRETLKHAVIAPLRSNAGFLVRLLDQADFVTGNVDTGLIERAGDDLLPPERPTQRALEQGAARLADGGPLQGFRLNAPTRSDALFSLDGAPIAIALTQAATAADASVLITEDGQSWRLTRWRVDHGPESAPADGAILSPMPGRVVMIAVKEGQHVRKGELLMVVEAMKMEYRLNAPQDGVVTGIALAVGGNVTEKQLLATVTSLEGD